MQAAPVAEPDEEKVFMSMQFLHVGGKPAVKSRRHAGHARSNRRICASRRERFNCAIDAGIEEDAREAVTLD